MVIRPFCNTTADTLFTRAIGPFRRPLGSGFPAALSLKFFDCVSMKRILAFIFAVLLSANLLAHEYWFEPETFFLAPRQSTPVRLYVGDGLVKDLKERPYQFAGTPMFKLFSAFETRDLKATLTDGTMPVHRFSADRAGNYLLAMEKDWSYIKIEPQKFEDYLRNDGMEYIIAERAQRGESGQEGRERYSRFIKSLLQVGNRHDETYQKTAGLRLEITPLENPYAKQVGDLLTFQVTFEGKPLIGKTVFADNRNSATRKMTTDSNGTVTMKIDRSGLWLVRLVFMQRCETNCNETDWESFWGAFSFGVKEEQY